ncbi:MAG: hypothetical protein AAF694_27805 [Bacteroidota bacterium]
MDRKLPKKHRGKSIAIAAAICVGAGIFMFGEHKFWQYLFFFVGFLLALFAAITAEMSKNQNVS